MRHRPNQSVNERIIESKMERNPVLSELFFLSSSRNEVKREVKIKLSCYGDQVVELRKWHAFSNVMRGGLNGADLNASPSLHCLLLVIFFNGPSPSIFSIFFFFLSVHFSHCRCKATAFFFPFYFLIHCCAVCFHFSSYFQINLIKLVQWYTFRILMISTI